MHVAFLNPQGNFDSTDSHLTQHPDFGGQLVYVKQVALALGGLGCRVDILTRQIKDPVWPEFSEKFAHYPSAPNVHIVRLPAGPEKFLCKESLWPHLVRDWTPNIIRFYREEGRLPAVFTAHYGDGGLSATLLEEQTGIPFTFTAHSLGAQKMDKLGVTVDTLSAFNARYAFAQRIVAERLSMNRSAVNITSTQQERFEQYAHRAYAGAVEVGDDSRFAVIPPGVNLGIFDREARAADEDAVQRYLQTTLARDLAEGRRDLPVIIASSRLDAKKNHLALVQAFAQTPELQRRANLIISATGLNDPLRVDADVGDEEKAVLAQIRAVVDAQNLWGKLGFVSLRNQTALAAAYRFFAQRPGSVFALTAHYEPFGLAPLEAAAAGLPVVVTQNGGAVESLREGKVDYGVLVDPADPADIACGIRRLLDHPTTWAEFVQRGRQRVLERYTWERTARRYLARLEALVTAPPRRRPLRLPLHPYFLDPQPENAVSLEELGRYYLDPNLQKGG